MIAGEGVVLDEVMNGKNEVEIDSANGSFKTLLAKQANNRNRRHLNIRATIAPDAKPVISILVDGEPVSTEVVRIGAEQLQLPLDGTPIPLDKMLAEPNAYDAFATAKTLTVCVWYIPPSDKITAEEMDSDMRQALEGLGYLE